MYASGPVIDTKDPVTWNERVFAQKNKHDTIDRMRGWFTNTMHMLHAQGRFEQH